MKQTDRSLDNSALPGKTEEERIKEAYARRQGNDARYSLFDQGHLFLLQQRERNLLDLLRRSGFESLASHKILEIGCGTGSWLREFIKWGAEPENIVGVDLLPERVARAKQLCPAGVIVQCGSAAQLTFPDAAFDLILQSTVFTSILDSAMKQQVASEMQRVLRKNGLIVWYDYHLNNPRNADVKGVKKREIQQLFPGCVVKLRRVTLAPPIARWIAPRSWLTAYLLERTSLLCTHYIGMIRKTQ